MKRSQPVSAWQKLLQQQLPLLGHRNWIAVVDSAYPWQTAPGVETIATGAAQLEVVSVVLQAVAKAGHVRPIVYLDAELALLPEQDAPGIGAYRAKLAKLAAKAIALPHDEIIAKLDAAGSAFRVLVLKTDMKLPYTSVFVQLDCGYWSAGAEQRLRGKAT